jgi:hypothetical protein
LKEAGLADFLDGGSLSTILWGFELMVAPGCVRAPM